MTFDILSWTDPMRETLIKNFQKNECLWNIIDVDYRNIAKKRQILCDMAKEMSETFGVCIGIGHLNRQWQSLRDQYRRAKKKLENANGHMKPWRFLQMLKFTDTSDSADITDPLTVYSSLVWDEASETAQHLSYPSDRPFSTPSASMFDNEIGDSITYNGRSAKRENDTIVTFSAASSEVTSVHPSFNSSVKNITVTCSPTVAQEIYVHGHAEEYSNGGANEILGSMLAGREHDSPAPSDSSIENRNDKQLVDRSSVPTISTGEIKVENQYMTGRKRLTQNSLYHGVDKRSRFSEENQLDDYDEFITFSRTVEKKLGLIACRNRRLYLIAQKKIMDCLFEAEFELLEHENRLAMRNRPNFSGQK